MARVAPPPLCGGHVVGTSDFGGSNTGSDWGLDGLMGNPGLYRLSQVV